MNYKNHLTGSINGFYYSIQGNILLGASILQQMESNFRSTKGDLACRLMAAMQGANVPGADTRCAGNNTSSLFAFLKVSQPIDTFGQPSLLVAVRTKDGDQIEPVDSLQKLFNAVHSCGTLIIGTVPNTPAIAIYPNPVFNNTIQVDVRRQKNDLLQATLMNSVGMVTKTYRLHSGKNDIKLGDLPKGFYLLLFVKMVC